jgi:hypothetical protein
MNLIKYFENKILLFEFLEKVFYDKKENTFYPINSIRINGQYKSFINKGLFPNIKDIGYIEPKALNKPIKIFFYSRKIKESTLEDLPKDEEKLYLEVNNSYYPIINNVIYQKNNKKEINISDDKKSLTFNNQKYYLDSKTIRGAYVIAGKKDGQSGSDDFASEMAPEEKVESTPAEETPPEETK